RGPGAGSDYEDRRTLPHSAPRRGRSTRCAEAGVRDGLQSLLPHALPAREARTVGAVFHGLEGGFHFFEGRFTPRRDRPGDVVDRVRPLLDAGEVELPRLQESSAQLV